MHQYMLSVYHIYENIHIYALVLSRRVHLYKVKGADFKLHQVSDSYARNTLLVVLFNCFHELSSSLLKCFWTMVKHFSVFPQNNWLYQKLGRFYPGRKRFIDQYFKKFYYRLGSKCLKCYYFHISLGRLWIM